MVGPVATISTIEVTGVDDFGGPRGEDVADFRTAEVPDGRRDIARRDSAVAFGFEPATVPAKFKPIGKEPITI